MFLQAVFHAPEMPALRRCVKEEALRQLMPGLYGKKDIKGRVS